MQIHYGFNSSTDLKWEREGKEIRMEDKIFVRALFAFFSSRLLLRSPIGTANIKGTDDSVIKDVEQSVLMHGWWEYRLVDWQYLPKNFHSWKYT